MLRNEFDDLKLLYVEDEDNIRKNAMAYFNRLFDQTYEAKNALEAFEVFKECKPHIIITDIKMTKMSGLDLIKQVRQLDTKCQIIILTAFVDTKYLLEAVELNLVKYLIKPIRHDTMYEVLKQCVKNINEKKSNLTYLNSEYIFDGFNKTLLHKKEFVKLSRNERDFLQLLCQNLTRVVTYEEIESIIWYDSVMSEDALRSMVRKLRKKLPLNCLENISKVGYKIRCL
jgi:YesN/AraC family two-component response regulator